MITTRRHDDDGGRLDFGSTLSSFSLDPEKRVYSVMAKSNNLYVSYGCCCS
jgi:hypothetical protein